MSHSEVHFDIESTYNIGKYPAERELTSLFLGACCCIFNWENRKIANNINYTQAILRLVILKTLIVY